MPNQIKLLLFNIFFFVSNRWGEIVKEYIIKGNLRCKYGSGSYKAKNNERANLMDFLARYGTEQFFYCNEEKQQFVARTKNMPGILKKFFYTDGTMNLHAFLDCLLEENVNCKCPNCKN